MKTVHKQVTSLRDFVSARCQEELNQQRVILISRSSNSGNLDAVVDASEKDSQPSLGLPSKPPTCEIADNNVDSFRLFVPAVSFVTNSSVGTIDITIHNYFK